jgi:hypothetical protein
MSISQSPKTQNINFSVQERVEEEKENDENFQS